MHNPFVRAGLKILYGRNVYKSDELFAIPDEQWNSREKSY
jgi:hypothetical protein